MKNLLDVIADLIIIAVAGILLFGGLAFYQGEQYEQAKYVLAKTYNRMQAEDREAAEKAATKAKVGQFVDDVKNEVVEGYNKVVN